MAKLNFQTNSFTLPALIPNHGLYGFAKHPYMLYCKNNLFLLWAVYYQACLIKYLKKRFAMQPRVDIDRLIKIVSSGGKVKTGIDIYNKNNVLLLEQNVLVDSISVLKNIKKSGVRTLPIFPGNEGGLWDENGNNIDLKKQTKAFKEKRSFENIPAGSISVEKKLKEISRQRKEASENYIKAKNNIKKILGDIRNTGGEFDYTTVENTVSDLVDYLSTHENGFSYLTKEIFDYDDYLHNHCVNVCTIGTAITTRFNRLFSKENDLFFTDGSKKTTSPLTEIDSGKMRDIAAGLFLHDIGKVLIPDKILNKQGKLTNKEYLIVKKHSYEKGLEILKKNNIDNIIIQNIVMYHHANLFQGEEGCYPDKKSEDLPLYVKISKLADLYDAMTSKRCYKDAFNPINVVTTIFRQYAQKDPALQGVLYAFVKSIGIYPPGSVVKLISGQYAYILDSQGPLIVPFTDNQGTTLSDKQAAVNLSEDSSVAVDTEVPLISPIKAFGILPGYLKEMTFLLS